MIKNMATESLNGLLEVILKVNINMIKNLDTV